MSAPTKLTGIGASRGIGIGKLRLLHVAGRVVSRRVLGDDELSGEVERFVAAVEASRDEIRRAQGALTREHEQLASMFDAYLLMHTDALLIDATANRIRRENANVEWALHQTVDELKRPLLQSESPYFQERARDIEHVQQHLLRHLRGSDAPSYSPCDDDIIVARDLTPADAVRILGRGVAGLVTEIGGATSHTAILARTFGVPAVVGIGAASATIRDRLPAIVDGFEGCLVVEPTSEDLRKAEGRQARYRAFASGLSDERGSPVTTTDGEHFTISANVELPSEASAIIDAGADGIGLYRTEFLCVDAGAPPSEEEQARVYREVASAVAPHPVVFRTFDWAGDKRMLARNLSADWYRADWFRQQVRAVLAASDVGNVRIMFPMVANVGEVDRAKAIVRSCTDALRREGKKLGHVDVGVMVEVPSAALRAREFASRCDFLSIGTNDLVQYTLALDRRQHGHDPRLSALHPSVLALIERTIAAAADAEVSCSICGDMAADPVAVTVAVGLGCRELSVPPTDIDLVRAVVRRIAVPEAKEVAERALGAASPEEVRQIVVDRFHDALGELWQQS